MNTILYDTTSAYTSSYHCYFSFAIASPSLIPLNIVVMISLLFLFQLSSSPSCSFSHLYTGCIVLGLVKVGFFLAGAAAGAAIAFMVFALIGNHFGEHGNIIRYVTLSLLLALLRPSPSYFLSH
jgi:hypothetical protein